VARMSGRLPDIKRYATPLGTSVREARCLAHANPVMVFWLG
jgi:hypothetical protein